MTTNQTELTGFLHFAPVADLLHLAFSLVFIELFALLVVVAKEQRYLIELSKAEHVLQNPLKNTFTTSLVRKHL